jgi:hypothetical protein
LGEMRSVAGTLDSDKLCHTGCCCWQQFLTARNQILFLLFTVNLLLWCSQTHRNRIPGSSLEFFSPTPLYSLSVMILKCCEVCPVSGIPVAVTEVEPGD